MNLPSKLLSRLATAFQRGSCSTAAIAAVSPSGFSMTRFMAGLLRLSAPPHLAAARRRCTPGLAVKFEDRTQDLLRTVPLGEKAAPRRPRPRLPLRAGASPASDIGLPPLAQNRGARERIPQRFGRKPLT